MTNAFAPVTNLPPGTAQFGVNEYWTGFTPLPNPRRPHPGLVSFGDQAHPLCESYFKTQQHERERERAIQARRQNRTYICRQKAM